MKALVTNNLTGKTAVIEVKEDNIVDVFEHAMQPTETELLQAKIDLLEARLAKVEAVPLVKTALEPVIIKDPIISK